LEVLGWILAFLKLFFVVLYFVSFAGIAYMLTIGNIKLLRSRNKTEFKYKLLYNLGFISVFVIIIWLGNLFLN
jgi:hypothetical protein